MNLKTIYSKRLAYYLRQNGFKIIKTGINENHPEFDTYLFEETPELIKAVGDYLASR